MNIPKLRTVSIALSDEEYEALTMVSKRLGIPLPQLLERLLRLSLCGTSRSCHLAYN